MGSHLYVTTGPAGNSFVLPRFAARVGGVRAYCALESHRLPCAVVRVFFFILFALSQIASALGAPETAHWAFQPVRVDTSAGRTLDAFVEKQLAAKGLSFAPEADRHTLIRRLYLDLHGLPPTPEQVERFLHDPDPEARASLIDNLLDSPRYGERWAQHWLDVVRYADTHGYEVNTERPNAWPYRDYVIKAFNDDKPYDRFVFEQLAGDSVGADAATGFLVAAAALLPGQIGKDEASMRLARQDALDEIIVGTCETFLGLSVGCARCHDHKFDPISQRDYYAMQAFFAGVEYGDREIENEEVASLSRKVAEVKARLDRVEPLASTPGTFLLVDDEDTGRTTLLRKKNGHGVNPEGSGRGYRDDPGGVERVPNLSGGRYTWWDNRAGADVFTYDPGLRGAFRIWISWGVHGSGVHTRDARYVLDRDGDLGTRDDQEEIARADQYYFTDVTEGETEKKPLWSGLLDSGVHELKAHSRLIVRGGETGSGITADAVLFQRSAARAAGVFPPLRPPVNAARNVERFAPIQVRSVRFTALATIDNNKHEPCIDELEVFAAGTKENIASRAKLSSSGNYSDIGIHRLKHLNDGRYGNSRSWISSARGGGWVQLDFADSVSIDRIVWGRDREGKFKDRLAYRYRIEVALAPGDWVTVASSQDRLPHGTAYDPVVGMARHLPPDAPKLLKRDVSELVRLEKRLLAAKEGGLVYGGRFREPDLTYVLHRGDPEQKGDRIEPRVPGVLGGLELTSAIPEQERRIALARWIASSANSLTARVMANRIWQFHFGQGLVATPSDFGTNGAKPSHPELLDWLAAELVRSGWSVKHLHRLILNSRTYRQSNRIHPEAAKIDGECRLLWRFPSRRVEAEVIRDGILAVSGQLSLRMGGPGFNFFTKRGGLDGYPPVEEFSGDGLRRMIYAHKIRMEKVPVFGAFDCPDAGQAMPRRAQSTTAIQALNLFNSPFVITQAEAFARRIEAEEAGLEEQIDRAYRLAFGRAPSDDEAVASRETVGAHGLRTLCRVLLNSTEFLYLP